LSEIFVLRKNRLVSLSSNLLEDEKELDKVDMSPQNKEMSHATSSHMFCGMCGDMTGSLCFERGEGLDKCNMI